MTFDLDHRLKRGVAAALAVGVLGIGAADGIAAASGTNSPKPVSASVAKAQRGLPQAQGSTVPASRGRAETAAEDVISYLEKGKAASSRAEARTLKRLAHGRSAHPCSAFAMTDTKARCSRLIATSRSSCRD